MIWIIVAITALFILFWYLKSAGNDQQTRTSDILPDFKSRTLELLQSNYDNLIGKSKKIDADFVTSYIIPLLSNKPIGRDEFERKEFEKCLPQKIDELKNTLFCLERTVYVSIREFNFDHMVFPIDYKIDPLGKINNAYVHYIVNIDNAEFSSISNSFTHYERFSEIDDAKKWKTTQKTFQALCVRLIFKPSSYSSSYVTCGGCHEELNFILMGLRVYDEDGRVQWSPDIR